MARRYETKVSEILCRGDGFLERSLDVLGQDGWHVVTLLWSQRSQGGRDVLYSFLLQRKVEVMDDVA